MPAALDLPTRALAVLDEAFCEVTPGLLTGVEEKKAPRAVPRKGNGKTWQEGHLLVHSQNLVDFDHRGSLQVRLRTEMRALHVQKEGSQGVWPAGVTLVEPGRRGTEELILISKLHFRVVVCKRYFVFLPSLVKVP